MVKASLFLSYVGIVDDWLNPQRVQFSIKTSFQVSNISTLKKSFLRENMGGIYMYLSWMETELDRVRFSNY